jgi:hypothetical protein
LKPMTISQKCSGRASVSNHFALGTSSRLRRDGEEASDQHEWKCATTK